MHAGLWHLHHTPSSWLRDFGTMSRVLIGLTLVMSCLVVSCMVAQADDKERSKPWKGKPHTIPGKVEAEHYDEGPAGVAYHDVEEKNLGEPYRKATQVDIEKRDDASNGHGVGWTRKGEWLKYTVNVKQAGKYRVVMPVASNKKGGVFHFEIDGKDISGPVHVPDTGGWGTLKVISHKGLPLPQGVHTIKVVMDKQGPSGSIGDIDYFDFKRQK